MAMYNYQIDGNVAIVTMNNGENRFSIDSVREFKALLDEIEGQTKVNALVTVSAHEKIWSNGIDLDWLLPKVQKEGLNAMNHFLVEMYKLFRRLLSMPMPTVAAINGHAFAGGAFLALSHDFRFMRGDRGWLCLPEVDLGIPLGPVFMAITRQNVPNFLLYEMQYTARRMTAQECEAHHLIMKACPLEKLMEESVAFAKKLNKGREIMQKMKLETLAPIITVIDEEIAKLSA
ncbi:MAG: enoyl-CoA hydratase/isomerase family protein [Desulfobacteraceae bacterium]|nr:enoyl-CoA hydratase/isomerase family protein [Desulfobacteraceae bacterium]